MLCAVWNKMNSMQTDVSTVEIWIPKDVETSEGETVPTGVCGMQTRNWKGTGTDKWNWKNTGQSTTLATTLATTLDKWNWKTQDIPLPWTTEIGVGLIYLRCCHCLPQ